MRSKKDNFVGEDFVQLFKLAGLGSRIRSWSRSQSRSRSRSQLGPGVFGSLEPELIEKKTRSRSRLEKKSGAGAAKNIVGSSALLEDKKHKEIVLLLLFFW